MPATYDLISSQTATGSSSAIQFTSIPSTYTDLVLVFDGSVSSGTLYLAVQIGSGSVITSGIYNYQSTFVSGTTVSIPNSIISDTRFEAYTQTGAGNRLVATFDFAAYKNTNIYKTIFSRSGSFSSTRTFTWSGGVAQTLVAVDTIKIFSIDGQNLQNTTVASLYGIKAA